MQPLYFYTRMFWRFFPRRLGSNDCSDHAKLGIRWEVNHLRREKIDRANFKKHAAEKRIKASSRPYDGDAQSVNL